MSEPKAPEVLASKTDNNFIAEIIQSDVNAGLNQVVTRFPPEPNVFLHIGHAKSICTNFGLAQRFGGECNLRFDDTNPAKEDQKYVDAIIEDVTWLGFEWAGEVKYASHYFQQLYQWAVYLVEQGKAYVCELSAEQASEYRGWATEPGKNSPYRERSVEDNLQLLERMRVGDMPEGSAVLRAKIDMSSANMNLRDPILYRIRHASHHQTGDTWKIYPSYDFAHGQEDAIEGVTHSVCTLEFQDHRPLYDWFVEQLPVPSKPRQFEFGRLNINYTVTSKRKLKQLVDDNLVNGWDDPRMPTISGLRRRGVSAQALRNFCDTLAVSKTDGVVDVAQLDYEIRDDLNKNAKRAMCVLNPLKVTLRNYDEICSESTTWLKVANHPQDESLGKRDVPFSSSIFIDASDFNTDSTIGKKKFKRLVMDSFVRLRGAYVIKACDFIEDNGEVIEVIADIVADTLGQNPEPEFKPRGVIHWVSAEESKPAEIRHYQRLFTAENPDKAEGGYLSAMNPESFTVTTARVEPAAAAAEPETSFQFEREGYYTADRFDHHANQAVFNLTIGLREGV